ncbi:MAG: hypothetical protein AB1384_01855 [Actinomycetota bacterium]
MSETIYPAASRHSMRLVYKGCDAGGAPQPAPLARLAGGESIDLSGSGPARPGVVAAAPQKMRDRGAGQRWP